MNIYEFFDEAIGSLQKWIRVHYHPAYWADDWLSGESIIDSMQKCEGTMLNRYFEFDWRLATSVRMFERNEWKMCVECQSPEMGVLRPELGCQTCGGTVVDATETMVLDYLQELEGWDWVDPDLAYEAMVNEGFQLWVKSLESVNMPVAFEIIHHLKALSDAGNSEDALPLAMWTLGVNHRNGGIVGDYSSLTYHEIDEVRSRGIKEMFGEEDVEKFLAGGYPPFTLDRPMLNAVIQVLKEYEHAEA